MPTYDYRCTACGHAFELFQSMSAKHEKKCPKCGRNALERLIGTGAAVLFKGSGFYQTDYRSDGYKKAADADKPAAETAAKSEAQSGVKPEAKGDGSKSETRSESKADAKNATKPDSKAESKPESKHDSKPTLGKPRGKPGSAGRSSQS